MRCLVALLTVETVSRKRPCRKWTPLRADRKGNTSICRGRGINTMRSPSYQQTCCIVEGSLTQKRETSISAMQYQETPPLSLRTNGQTGRAGCSEGSRSPGERAAQPSFSLMSHQAPSAFFLELGTEALRFFDFALPVPFRNSQTQNLPMGRGFLGERVSSTS